MMGRKLPKNVPREVTEAQKRVWRSRLGESSACVMVQEKPGDGATKEHPRKEVEAR